MRVSATMPFAKYHLLSLHDIGDDHYHEDGDYALDFEPEDDGLWQADHVSLVSVGIDIGSSGSQVIFSRIELARMAADMSSRYFVVSRTSLYQSPISLTPYATGLTIDARALGAIMDDAYHAAGLRPDQVDTGAVILTGEALRRENAHNIAHILADRGGNFVCTMAGHHIEAMLAGYGSGAAYASNSLGAPVLNIDIGGGTTKYALVESGKVVATAALHIGGRLAVFNADGQLVRLEPAGIAAARATGFDWKLGDTVPVAERLAVAIGMAEALIAAISSQSDADDALWLTPRLVVPAGVQHVMFSGGVSEFIYGNETRDFGDLGRLIGQHLASRRTGDLPWAVLPAGAGIRATALGLSEYSVQLSGNTIYAPDPDAVLPRRNLRVLHPRCELSDQIDPKTVAHAIGEILTLYDADPRAGDFALAFHWSGPPRFERIAALARGIVLGLGDASTGTRPISVAVDGDIARTLGRILHDELNVRAPLLIVDGVELAEFDYIDFGKLREPSHTVPITIKSLLFSKDPRNIAEKTGDANG
jgi:ethanolamine utilization protein EutA